MSIIALRNPVKSERLLKAEKLDSWKQKRKKYQQKAIEAPNFIACESVKKLPRNSVVIT
jgi:hypothetical protein